MTIRSDAGSVTSEASAPSHRGAVVRDPRPRPHVVPPSGSAGVVGRGLDLVTINVLASGTYDLASGNQVILHLRGAGIPFCDMGWHVLSALVLLVFLCVHVARRRGRVRRSVIR
jgi:hypothetical protein